MPQKEPNQRSSQVSLVNLAISNGVSPCTWEDCCDLLCNFCMEKNMGLFNFQKLELTI